MPTYDYECSACGHKHEIFEKVDHDGVKACPKCGKKKAVRLMGIGAGILFKGSGFHVTDYRKGTPPPPESKQGESKQGESKPAVPKPSEPAKKKTTRKEK